MNCSTLGTNMDPVMQPQEHMEVPFTEMLKAISAHQEETITMLNRMNEALFLICNQPKEEKPIKCMNDALILKAYWLGLACKKGGPEPWHAVGIYT